MFTRKSFDSRHVLFSFLFLFQLVGCDGDYPPPQLYEFQVQAFERQDKEQPPPDNAVVVTGSSSIQLWDTIEQDLSPVPIISRGFFGNNMNDTRFYANRMVVPYNPAIIMVYEGENDIVIGITPARLLEVYQQFVQRVRESLPSVQIYFISIKPSPSRWSIWPKAQEANALIQEYSSQDSNLHYIDVASKMLDSNGDVRPELFTEEALHLNSDGYRIWSETIYPILFDAYFGI